MNKKLLAIAVAAAVCAPAAAFADASGITLTGVVNGTIENTKLTNGGVADKNGIGIGTNATRWSLDGSEDLGGGLKAIFSLAVDQRFAGPGGGGGAGDPAGLNQSGGLFNRNSFIGLAGNWGSLKIGQNEHLYEIQQISQDILVASENSGNALDITTRWGIAGGKDFTRRDAQSIWYASPDFGGFSFGAAYITPGGAHGGTGDPKPYGVQLGGQYSISGLTLYGAYADYKHDNVILDDNKAYRLGAGYGMGNFQIDVSWEQLKAQIAGLGDAKRQNYYIGGTYRFGPSAIKASYQKAKSTSGSAGLTNNGAKEFTIGYWYDLSKRTSAYVGYAKLDNDTNATFVTGIPGQDRAATYIGVRHSF